MSEIYRQCVSSEDIRIDTGADCIMHHTNVNEIDGMLVKNGEWIGFIDSYLNILGSDYIIRRIKIYNDDNLSDKLTRKYLGKIVIFSEYKDR